MEYGIRAPGYLVGVADSGVGAQVGVGGLLRQFLGRSRGGGLGLLRLEFVLPPLAVLLVARLVGATNKGFMWKHMEFRV